ncbi:MAG: helix-turn-helix domain-containing protein [Ilumatobacteraceae bacterium]
MSETAATPPAPSTAGRDVSALRALAHPLRWSLIEVLLAEQTATATRCGQVLGEPVNSCSFHLRMLEKYGYVERVEHTTGREKPWRMTNHHVSWDSQNEDEAAVADELDDMLIEREAARQRDFIRTRTTIPAEWRRASYAHGTYRWMTPAELQTASDAVEAILDRYNERTDPDQRPQGARLVRLTSIGIPARPIA